MTSSQLNSRYSPTSWPPPLLALPPNRTPFLWQPSQHLALVGQTGTGKSTLASWLLDTQRQYKVILRSKSDDVRYAARTIHKAAEIDDQRYSAFVLDPRGKTPREKRAAQYTQFAEVLDKIFTEGGWTVYGDEMFYLSQTLRLGPELETMLTQGRSLGISFAGGMQRPVRVTRFMLTEATHVLAFRIESRDAKEFADATHEMVRGPVSRLPEHHFLWFRRPDRLWVGRLDLKEGNLLGAVLR